MWVFFYGSYMNPKVLEAWHVRPHKMKVARLVNWTIAFCPFATLVPNEGDCVYGILCRVSSKDAELLYSRTELSEYKSTTVLVKTSEMEELSAACYVASPKAMIKPSPAYLRLIIDAAEVFHFPVNYIKKLKAVQKGV